ncbi:nucleotidyl transferase AbiEii/AbiGii toxin family protein [Cryptosporangium minutisporangium]|uniref:Nucleotidyl transferase AbiEii/AbiGii toxin family protein n=1 Tax=Cryptosporangium minutisporangium TaxID=113569 RepID=A0ABP6SS45_9ACTN
MTPPDLFQHDVARIALQAAAAHGFVLGGGQALLAHGLVDRPTEDIDLFTTAERAVPAAATAVRAALETAGYTVHADDAQNELADLFEGFDLDYIEWAVTLEDRCTELTLAQLPYTRGPIILDVGPVMHPDDLLASKVAAAASRAEARDFIDIAAATRRYPLPRLLALGRTYDPGLGDQDFREAGHRLDTMNDARFAPYGLTPEQIKEVRTALTGWPRP